MQENKLKDKALLKVQSKIWEQKRFIREIESDVEKDNNIDFYRGDELNKSKRWYGACKKYDIDFFVTADGDDLFYDVGLSDLCFEQIENDYIDGQGLYNDVYGMTTKALKKILD